LKKNINHTKKKNNNYNLKRPETAWANHLTYELGYEIRITRQKNKTKKITKSNVFFFIKKLIDEC
jgi:hypothetical protein